MSRTARHQRNTASTQVYVYRSIHPKHIKLADARKGMAVPGDPHSDMSPEDHNVLNESGASPYTSWTYSVDVARRFAQRPAAGGVILRLPKTEPPEGAIWQWVRSPDLHNEQEVLLLGVRIDAEVMSDD